MSSRAEIRDAFAAELRNTEEYQIVMTLKQNILNEIATPNIQPYVNYTFPTEQTQTQVDVIKMCMQLEFGFITFDIGSRSVGIDMIKFLD